MKILKALLLTWLMTSAGQWACGQQTGEVTGTVTDATGALVAEATVTATNTATQQVRSAASWRPGNESRNTLFTPGSQDFDASLSKDIHIWESHSLNFRFETFNTLNHPNWNVPANDPRNLATFGVITSAGAMRQLQFALKYSF